MSERFTKAAARNIFYGGSAFFFVAFIALTAHSHYYIVRTSTDAAGLTDSVARGKHVWERNSCINCHSLHGEGAYFAPELGNVWVRYGGPKDAGGARAALIAWMQSQPSGVPGRRQMPNFHLNDQDLNDLVDFLSWASRTNKQGWPPNDAG
ncbi:c-type cytochrome [Methylobacterium sp. 092160098-2]|jgi:nitric oxide reductase subunit C|uniref:c-type cytochrome n=1 Tax=Methylobacterium sp. 092160098-2 TaxID=3025129 RepID=UPI0023819F88|nr:cytochrome c [Methylobacterium sp. 092160098-2]MDE4914689.1 cytochrome c [Methylobacterium sp. 092160098-2]